MTVTAGSSAPRASILHVALLAMMVLIPMQAASNCFGPYRSEAYALAACVELMNPDFPGNCGNGPASEWHYCGYGLPTIRIYYHGCIEGNGDGCVFTYYDDSQCPSGEWHNPDTGVCVPEDQNPSPAKNFGACRTAQSDFVGNPVKTSTGNKFTLETDHEGFGRGVLRFERSYNSGLALMDPPRPVWRHTFDRRIRETTAGSSVLRAADRPDGRSLYFSRINHKTGLWDSDADVHEKLVHSANAQHVITEYRLTLTDGTLETYDENGTLQSITDLAGNTRTLTYDESGYLVRVEANTGEYFTFGYDAEDRHSMLTDHTGRTWIYTYDASGNLEYVYYPDGSTDTHTNNPYRRYHYEDPDFPSALTGISDRLRGQEERYATWTYDADGRVTASYHGPQTSEPADRIDGVTIDYIDAFTRTVTNSNDVSSTYTTISQLGAYQLAGVTGPGCTGCGNGDSSYTYDPDTNDLLAETENGVVTEYGDYTDRGEYRYKTVAKGTAEERRIDYTYDPRFHGKIAIMTEPSVNPNGNRVTAYGYDDFGNRTSATVTGYAPHGQGGWMPVSRITAWQYGGDGTPECDAVPLRQLCRIDGPRTDVSDVTTLSYYPDAPAEGNNRARLRQIMDATGHLVRSNIQYTATGKVASEDRLNNLSLSYSYHPGNDRLETLTESDGVTYKVTRWTYLATGEVETITTAYGTQDATTLTFGYDGARRLIRVTDGIGNYIEYILDTEGNRLEENTYDNNGTLQQVLTRTFDAYNRLDLRNIGGEPNNPLETYDPLYSPDGVLDRSVDGRGMVTDYDYDALQRLVARTRDSGGLDAVTRYGYDAGNRLMQVTDPNDGTTTYRYDDLGNLLRTDSPDTGTTVYTYDAAGNLKTRLDAMGQQLNYSYDALNRLTGIDAPYAYDDIIYVYDDCTNGEGRLCSVSTGGTTVNYSYDAFGNITAHQRMGYGYDNANRLKTLTYPSGAVVTYQHDAAGQVRQVDLAWDGNTTRLAGNIHYKPFGGISYLTYGNGKYLLWGYDQAYRTTYQFTSGTMAIFHQDYDPSGNLLQRYLWNGADADASYYGYDSLDRLDAATGDIIGSRGYDYDLNGNRTAMIGDTVTTSYGYEVDSNRMISETGWTYTLDGNGNTIAKLDTEGEGRLYGYDIHNRLIYAVERVVSMSGAQQTYQDTVLGLYSYNGLGQRVSKLLGNRRYLYGTDGALLAELDNFGRVLQEYIYLNGQLLATLVSEADQNGSLYYVHNDHLGAPQVMTNESGVTVWRASYDPFGNADVDEDPDRDGKPVTLNVRFPGQYYDQWTGLHYNIARYYDPDSGRYLTADPLGLHAGLNVYSYVFNNPIILSDPLGLYTSARWIQKPQLSGVSRKEVGEMGFAEHWTLIPPAAGIGGVWWMVTAHIKGVVECIDEDECEERKDVFNVQVDLGKRVGIGYGITTAPLLQYGRQVNRAFSDIADAVSFYQNQWTQLAIQVGNDPMAWCTIADVAGL